VGEFIKYRKGYKYQLVETCSVKTAIHPESLIWTEYIRLTKDGTLTISRGYAWDGASGPTYDSKCSMRGSLYHDALYQLMRLGLLDRSWRDKADELLRKTCIEDGMWKVRANIWWTMVDKLAGFACKPEAEPEILTAP